MTLAMTIFNQRHHVNCKEIVSSLKPAGIGVCAANGSEVAAKGSVIVLLVFLSLSCQVLGSIVMSHTWHHHLLINGNKQNNLNISNS